jgi:capsular polysaccharide transport system permease protein
MPGRKLTAVIREHDLETTVTTPQAPEAESSEAPKKARPRRAAAPATPLALPPVPPTVGPARARFRHWGVLAAFLLMVPGPVAIAAWYLNARAVDQFASTVGFSVRSEETQSLGPILGGLGQIAGPNTTDAEVLYRFILSQEMVAAIDARLDLRAVFSRHHAQDPVFGLDPSGTIEDLTDYWPRMVRVAYDASTGLIEIEVRAFSADEARGVALAVFDESRQRINDISAIAREDATRYAREDLAHALERLKSAREAVTAFRSRTLIVDPTADLQGQMSILTSLQAQLAEALIQRDLLRDVTRESDPRIVQAEARIAVIRARIDAERARFGPGGEGPGGEDYATLVAEFERLAVEREFAEQAYVAALAALDTALAQAQRISRYLAPHITPTLAERPRYPDRPLLMALVALFGFLAWAIVTLVYYSIRDRR